MTVPSSPASSPAAALPVAVRAGAAGLPWVGRLLDTLGLSSVEPDQPADLLLHLVGPADVASLLQELQTCRAHAEPCRVLVAAIDLDEAALDALLCAGICDYLRLPGELADLALRVRRALGRLQSGAESGAALAPHPHLRGLVGNSPAFVQQLARLPAYARCDANVMILGDTGTGKEACAQAIHYLSPRAGAPWVAVNCAAIPADLIEAELFGHVRGAYTHAHASRQGLVGEAEGGTLFLDEVDSLPFASQGKLLRFLQEKEYRPVGSSRLLHANVRVIAASNRALTHLGAAQGFRQDLLYRLNVLTLHLPTLRERRSDIAQLALHFLQAAGAQWRRPAPSLTPAALRRLLGHDWPGNVRELRNVIERAVLLCPGDLLDAADIDFDGAPGTSPMPSDDESFRAAKARVVDDFERQYIEHLLASHGGNITHAAQAAKKNRRAFFELMRKHQIAPQHFRDPLRGAA
ncbi:sigma-54-dependent Fis family transcriptional regulator [Ideonella sp. 4Y11]|uniref:Sigma-54-dependent Fis family transcriptional regulator n=1 Tax=Ideonella aquatica TaxID=2824119 RepID=A0A941BI58_9BURK|nr:sigma-54 dependent transcriptional regulator [Ideonella aquatica]MBQ0957508.1 sigma-54-dependent Fis family transcriptional regulator [Ideonella aquatica]